MSLFDDAIASGMTAAESAWGVSWTCNGSTFTGTFDRRRDDGEPDVGGYLPQEDGVLVASATQFTDGASLLDESGSEILDEASAAIEDETGSNVPDKGDRITVLGSTYLIRWIEYDSHSYTFGLKSVNR